MGIITSTAEGEQCQKDFLDAFARNSVFVNCELATALSREDGDFRLVYGVLSLIPKESQVSEAVWDYGPFVFERKCLDYDEGRRIVGRTFKSLGTNLLFK